MPEVLTPLTWSLVRATDNEMNLIPGYYLMSGNIGGRAYTNVNMLLSILYTFGVSIEQGLKMITVSFGHVPEGVSVPVFPYSRLGLLKIMIPRLARYMRKFLQASRNVHQFLQDTPEWCQKMSASIKEVKTKEKLLSLWKEEIYPYSIRAMFTLLTCGSKIGTYVKLSETLTKLMGTEDANTLISNFRGDAELASLGPVVGLARLIKGEMTREEYLMRYGHRGPNELELSILQPGEDECSLESQIEEFKNSNTDVEGLLNRQRAQYEDAWNRFTERYPDKVKQIEKQLKKVSEVIRLREALRSEVVRVNRVARVFALRIGELTGIENQVFFLYIDEVLNLLGYKCRMDPSFS
jgi:pyruvate,water dikinase